MDLGQQLEGVAAGQAWLQGWTTKGPLRVAAGWLATPLVSMCLNCCACTATCCVCLPRTQPSIPHLLQLMSKNRVPSALVTTMDRHTTDALLERLGLRHYFTCTVTGRWQGRASGRAGWHHGAVAAVGGRAGGRAGGQESGVLRPRCCLHSQAHACAAVHVCPTRKQGWAPLDHHSTCPPLACSGWHGTVAQR